MRAKNTTPKRTSKVARASISFPSTVYEELERLAAERKVSLAWIVRDAAEKYVASAEEEGKVRQR